MSTPAPQLDSPDPEPSAGEDKKKVTPLRCLSGALLAGSLALLLSRLTRAIATSFAAHPLSTHQQIVYNLSVAVRTLVVGMSTMATGIFAIAALGLVGLAIQLIIQRFRTPPPPPANT